MDDERPDMDLFQVLPETRSIVEPVGAVSVLTNGCVEDGELKTITLFTGHNTLQAFFELADDVDIDPEMAQFRRIAPIPYWTNQPCIKCSMKDVFRNCWLHRYAIVLRDRQQQWVQIWSAMPHHEDFFALLYHIRGVHPLGEARIREIKQRVVKTVEESVQRVITVVGKPNTLPVEDDIGNLF